MVFDEEERITGILVLVIQNTRDFYLKVHTPEEDMLCWAAS
jgi:hypothetical protein